MSIEKMNHIVMLIPAGEREEFIQWLYNERQVHLEEFDENHDQWSERFLPIKEDISKVETTISFLQASLDFFHEYSKEGSDFLESLFPVNIVTSHDELIDAMSSVDPQKISSETQRLRNSLELLHDEYTQLLHEHSRLKELEFITVDIKCLKNLRHLSVAFVCVSISTEKRFPHDARFEGNIAYERIMERGTQIVYVLYCPLSELEQLQEIISDYGLRELPLPHIDGTIANELQVIDSKIDLVKSQSEELLAETREFSLQWKHKVTLAHAYWESERFRILQQEFMVSSPYMFVSQGYIRARELKRFRQRVEEKFHGAEIQVIKDTEDHDPPVSVTWNKLLRPAGLLVKMFGLPSYRSIDPTGFLTLTFLIFFGICYGDVLYGIMLIGLASWLKRRFKTQEGLVQFFRLFSYAGISTIIFGIVTGSWGSDLPAYLWKGNFIEVLRQKFALIDPLTKPVVALAIAICIGIFNQLYGIFVRFIRDTRRGDVASGVYDGIFWLVYLVSLIGASVSFIVKAPAWITGIFLAGFFGAAIGLILTQGRDQKSWVLRLITGVVSLYGIMGTYGTTAFIGDVISYSRLMALGMTTSVVGMSFNIIGGMVKEVPYLGWLLFAVVIVFGHVFNFAMSILSAFVHSARLILLEWFSRFYEGGGVPFRPFGFQSAKLELNDK
ncbi:MAG TPA: V-type ATPase 116kDa subunit family protein [Anaerolineae bacterium]|nr:V-type ATPase 116kDa subunit family protein [Anaerolineae bacterium]